jgi:PAS domain S-box-containing protein
MAGSRADGSGREAPTGYPHDEQGIDRERERLVALHRVSTLVAQQRHADDVLREALGSAVSLIGGDAGAIHRWFPDSQTLRCVIAEGNHEPIVRGHLRPGQGLTGRVYLEQRSIIVNEYLTSSIGTPQSRSAGLRTAVAVPILHAGQCLAILSVGSYDPARTFDTDDAQLLELFAAMVGVALENADRNAELETRLDRVKTLSRLTWVAATCLDEDQVLSRIARAAVELAGADFATFWMADEAARMLRVGATSDDTLAAGGLPMEMPYGQGIAGWVAEHRESLTVDDVFTDERTRGLEWWRQHDVVTSLTVPVIHRGRLLAVLSLAGRTPFRLNVPELEVLESFLAQAAGGIRNASLYSSVRRSQEQLQQVIDHSPAAISLKDRDGRYMLTNRRWHEMFGPGGDLDTVGPIGRTDAEIYPPARARGLRERDLAVLTTGQIVELEGTLTAGPRPLTYHVTKFALTDATGQPYAVCSMSTDVTERKRWEQEIASALTAQRAANEQLERLNKAKSDFVSIVSHEFRSPLTGIQGFSELMRDEAMSADEIREYSADINREAERLNRMITELLDLDRMESGRMTLRPEPVDLGLLATGVVSTVAPRASRHRLKLQLDPTVPEITGDRDKLTQVLTNLVDNAIKYSPDGGEVTVGVGPDGDAAHVWVRDQGLGIPTDAVETIFERYTRIESGLHRSIHGTGLGLPIVRQIVELHGGRVWAESLPGVGSTFHVMLPPGPPVNSSTV